MGKTKTRNSGDRPPGPAAPARPGGNIRLLPVDILKGLAIISVILIHSFSNAILAAIGAPYHIWQAVPVFLLLAAFTGALSYRRLACRTLPRCYDLTVFYRRFRRIIPPFIAIAVLQVALLLWFLPAGNPLSVQYAAQLHAGIAGVIAFLAEGAAGPGNYFIPLFVVQILLLPFFYWLAIRYSPDAMLVSAFVLAVVIQSATTLAGLSPAATGLNYVNYLMLAALGIWFALAVRRQTAVIVIAGLFSAAYITAVYYFGFQFWFISPSAGFFTEFSCFWTLVLVMYGLRYLPASSSSRLVSVIAGLGKASWHIYLVQMTVFAFFVDAMFLAASNAMAGMGLYYPDLYLAGMTLFVLVLCLVIGYGFYLAESFVWKKYAGS